MEESRFELVFARLAEAEAEEAAGSSVTIKFVEASADYQTWKNQGSSWCLPSLPKPKQRKRLDQVSPLSLSRLRRIIKHGRIKVRAGVCQACQSRSRGSVWIKCHH